VPDSPEPDASNSNGLAPKGSPGREEGGSLNPELKDLAGKALEYHDSALSESTRKAYQRGWEDFTGFCEGHGFEPAPATEQAVALYLSARAEDLAPSTLSQRMAAIQHAHDERGLSSPTRSKSVQNVMRGIRSYRKMLAEMKEFLPDERVTRVRNMALVVTGVYLAESVHLSAIAKKLSLPGRLASSANRLRRFLKNPRVDVSRFYQPVAQVLLGSFEPWQQVRLLLDTTKVGFDHRVLTVSLACRSRALPLCWSVYSGRKGHLTAEKQIRLLRRVRNLLEEILPEECAVCVMGDSEFGRAEVFRWLKDQGWHYVLRASGQNRICWKGRWRKLGDLPLEEGQTREARLGPFY
jgi:hypothetical protein